MRRKPCSKTISGQHLFMPIEWADAHLHKVFEVHGVKQPMKCVACGMIDDTLGKETK